MQGHVYKEVDAHPIFVGKDSSEMGIRAGEDVAAEIRHRLDEQNLLRVIFAAAPSQSVMLETLALQKKIDWSRVTAFHMDEYLGLPENSPQSFSHWLRRMLFDRIEFGNTHLLTPGTDPLLTAKSYADKLSEAPIDIVCLGIGVNGHLAFNDPPADFEDPVAVKVVTLDPSCRQQQVDDGCFSALRLVPRQALTITLPTLLSARRIFCCVPGAMKKEAVRKTLTAPISNQHPATALRMHPSCTFYFDCDSAPEGIETNLAYLRSRHHQVN